MVDYPVNIPETVTVSESLTTLGAYLAPVPETVALSESEAVVAGFIEPLAEAVTGPVEGTEGIRGVLVGVGETVTGPSESQESSIDGGIQTLPLDDFGQGTNFRGRDGELVDIRAGIAAGLTTRYYRMRAWNLNTNGWELWTSENTPSATPPSGDPIINWSVVTQWEA